MFQRSVVLGILIIKGTVEQLFQILRLKDVCDQPNDVSDVAVELQDVTDRQTILLTDSPDPQFTDQRLVFFVPIPPVARVLRAILDRPDVGVWRRVEPPFIRGAEKVRVEPVANYADTHSKWRSVPQTANTLGRVGAFRTLGELRQYFGAALHSSRSRLTIRRMLRASVNRSIRLKLRIGWTNR